MKITQFALPTVALGIAAVLVCPKDSVAFSTIGGSLSLNQRDVRVFNNFTDTAANNNTTADANWPGYTGAPMSIWKGCGEWASELHGGTGAGDPLQTVGSGGANFDITWQGLAAGVGGTNDNIHSELSGSSGGVLAFTETPISDGWRIRYYSSWTWQDGPGSVSGGIDLQGVACHEFGHALGLGHSTDGAATMFPSISGTGTGQRSIAADDIAGVQFIYGVKSGSKPRITAVNNSNPLTITGTGFSATNNEVWFTNGSTSPTSGDPRVIVTGVSSTGGTSITVNVPATSGKGDVLVKNSAGSAGANLSNAFPVDPTAPPACIPPTVYCTGKVNSQFCSPAIGSTGTPTYAGTTSFNITGTQFLNNKNGLLFYGLLPNGASFQGGHLCVKLPVVRTSVQTSGGSPSGADCTGTYSYDFEALIVGGTDPNLIPGQMVYTQYWARDPADFTGFNTSLSEGLSFEICP
ncbi:MAG: matrixin family metalloprotease [Planctomycetes bacterium]|nr:matrixin family metalloprotease [Planctomycetota bacterium]